MYAVFLCSILGMGVRPSELGKNQDVKTGNWEKALWKASRLITHLCYHTVSCIFSAYTLAKLYEVEGDISELARYCYVSLVNCFMPMCIIKVHITLSRVAV